MKSFIKILLLLIIASLLTACNDDSIPDYPFIAPPPVTPEPGASLSIVMLYVGHGNSTLMIMPSQKIVLIDSGIEWAARKYVIPFLDRHGITKIDYFIITHYHADHIGAKDDIIEKYKVGTIWNNGSFKIGQAFDFEGTTMTVLNAFNPQLRTRKDKNQNSLSFHIAYNGFVYIDGGDIYEKEQNEILKEFDVRAHVYNTPHHMHGPVSKEYLIASDPYLFFTSADEDVYTQKAYTRNLADAIDYLNQNNGRLIESLVSHETGHLFVKAYEEADWYYYSVPDVGSGIVPDLFN